MDLQEGKFAENGGCGYILKPSIMLDEGYSPSERLPTTPQVLLTLYKIILSGVD